MELGAEEGGGGYGGEMSEGCWGQECLWVRGAQGMWLLRGAAGELSGE